MMCLGFFIDNRLCITPLTAKDNREELIVKLNLKELSHE